MIGEIYGRQRKKHYDIGDSKLEEEHQRIEYIRKNKLYEGIEDNFFDYLKRIQKEKEEQKENKN